MVQLNDIVSFCQEITGSDSIKDFSGAFNGLQFANDGVVTKIGAAVDAGLVPFRQAVNERVDFLIVHHGLFWSGAKPIVGAEYEKYRALIDGNLAVYSCHLPLDAHPEIGNNALLAKKLGIRPHGSFLPYEGADIGFVGEWQASRDELKDRLNRLFPEGIQSMEFGSPQPERICVVTGSGASAVERIRQAGADTLITGELKQHLYNQAQEQKLNLYACGHYATETFGVKALAAAAAKRFHLKWSFIPTGCPL